MYTCGLICIIQFNFCETTDMSKHLTSLKVHEINLCLFFSFSIVQFGPV